MHARRRLRAEGALVHRDIAKKRNPSAPRAAALDLTMVRSLPHVTWTGPPHRRPRSPPRAEGRVLDRKSVEAPDQRAPFFIPFDLPPRDVTLLHLRLDSVHDRALR